MAEFVRRELVELHKLAYRAENQGSAYAEALKSGEEANLTLDERIVLWREAEVELATEIVLIDAERNLGLG